MPKIIVSAALPAEVLGSDPWRHGKSAVERVGEINDESLLQAVRAVKDQALPVPAWLRDEDGVEFGHSHEYSAMGLSVPVVQWQPAKLHCAMS